VYLKNENGYENSANAMSSMTHPVFLKISKINVKN